MSATLDVESLSRYLDGARVIDAPGRVFPVEQRYAPEVGVGARPPEEQVRSAVIELFAAGLEGDVLVFLPGAREIRRCETLLGEWAQKRGVLVLPLHGSLPPEVQDAAVEPASRPKVILSTNVAETSITIDGVVAVIDSGLERAASLEAAGGLTSLRLRPISQASAAQRAGRAGRTRPGVCVRLYSQHDLKSRAAHKAPELLRTDLGELSMLLFGLGRDAAALPWLDAPPAEAMARATALLETLGAKERGVARLTETGQAMLGFAAEPRQARLIVEAARRGALSLGCLAAAVLGERDNQRGKGGTVPTAASDLVELAQLASGGRSRGGALRPEAVANIRKSAAQLERQARRLPRAATAKDPEVAVQLATLAAFPDRVAVRKAAAKPGSADELLFALGGRAVLSGDSCVREAPWVVAVAGRERDSRDGRVSEVTLASAIEPDWLIEIGGEALVEVDELLWNDSLRRVEQRSGLRYGELFLSESRAVAEPSPAAAALLAKAARQAGADRIAGGEELDSLRERWRLVADSGIVAGLEAPPADLSEMLMIEACADKVRLSELEKIPWLDVLRGHLGASLSAIERLAPSGLTLVGQRRLSIHYERGRPPYVSALIQDFFGTRSLPRLLDGRLALTAELLGPHKRPLQVTQDLESFWRTHYGELRRQLSRRYPRHSWPEDPANARPPEKPRRT